MARGPAGYISLHNWSIVKGDFIWLENYRLLFQDPAFWKALQVTVFYVVATVPLTMLISLVIAYLLFKPIRYRPFFAPFTFCLTSPRWCPPLWCAVDIQLPVRHPQLCQ